MTPENKRALDRAQRVPVDELQRALNAIKNPPDGLVASVVGPQTDLDELLALVRTNMSEMYAASDSMQWSDAQKRQELADSSARFIILRESTGGALAAFCCLLVTSEPCVDSSGSSLVELPVVYCLELQVAAAHQGQGAGRYLVSAAVRLSQALRLGKIMLTVLHNNERARLFYRRQGFSVDPVSPRLPGSDLESCSDSGSDSPVDYEILSLLVPGERV